MKTVQDWIAEKTAKLADVGTVPLAKAGLCWDTTDRESGPLIDMHVVNLDEAEAGHVPDATLWNAAGMPAAPVWPIGTAIPDGLHSASLPKCVSTGTCPAGNTSSGCSGSSQKSKDVTGHCICLPPSTWATS